MGVKFSMEEWTFGPMLRAKFHFDRCKLSPLRDQEAVMGRTSWKYNQLELELASRKCQLIRIRISLKKAIWLELATKIANWCELRLAAPHVFFYFKQFIPRCYNMQTTTDEKLHRHSKETGKSSWLASAIFVMVALWNRVDHYVFALWFLSSIFFFFSSPNFSGRILDVYQLDAMVWS